MTLLLFKFIMPPVLILLASLAGKRWGDAVGGWLVGLPLTSGPVVWFLAIQHGAYFAELAANGTLMGTVAQAAFSLCYGLLADRGWKFALAGGATSYAVVGLAFQLLPMGIVAMFLVALAALTVAATAIPSASAIKSEIASPWWDIPTRMVVVTTVVVALTAAASLLGALVAGLLASFPIFGSILTIYAHRTKGPEAARQVLRGMVFALYAFASFFLVIGLTIGSLGTVTAFAAAGAVCLLVQACALKLIRAPINPCLAIFTGKQRKDPELTTNRP